MLSRIIIIMSLVTALTNANEIAVDDGSFPFASTSLHSDEEIGFETISDLHRSEIIPPDGVVSELGHESLKTPVFPKSTNLQLSNQGAKDRVQFPATVATRFGVLRAGRPLKGAGGVGRYVLVGCIVNGVVNTLAGDNPIIGCIDGLVGTTGARYVPIMELEGITLPETHPDLGLQDGGGLDLRNSLLDTHTGRIANGPYQGKCIAQLNGYLTAVECGKPDSSKLILNQF